MYKSDEIYLQVGEYNICCMINQLEIKDTPIVMLHGLGASSNDFIEAASNWQMQFCIGSSKRRF